MTVYDMAALRSYIQVLEAERAFLQQRIREQWEPETREAYDDGLAAGHRDVLTELRCWEVRAKAAESALESARKCEVSAVKRVRELKQDRVGWIVLTAAGWLAFAWQVLGRLL